ncbi:MAG: cytochrome c3 family protein [Gemmatimonadota bacterium]
MADGVKNVGALRCVGGWRSPAVVALLVLAAACGTRDAQANGSLGDSTTAVLGAVAAGPVRPPYDPLADSAARAQQVPVDSSLAFPHAEHRSFQCTHCHQSVPGHGTHMAAANCSDCHAPVADYTGLPVRSRRECMACHHNPARKLACQACHDPGDRGVLQVPVSLRLSVWDSARVRVFNFDHRLHTTEPCNACHTTFPMYTPNTDCGACHAPHHRDGAQCSRCHTAPSDTTIHTLQAHGNCASCHTQKVIATLTPSREMCLICHADKAQHEVSQPCYECHLLGKSPTGVQP